MYVLKETRLRPTMWCLLCNAPMPWHLSYGCSRVHSAPAGMCIASDFSSGGDFPLCAPFAITWCKGREAHGVDGMEKHNTVPHIKFACSVCCWAADLSFVWLILMTTHPSKRESKRGRGGPLWISTRL